ncbi:hypothetical protein DL96DRAFT_1615548 [Flagelloscypha sp. PMI_526]|nr:hypothetical protein DL96DRAFT_1615548 [Flagelloscypha sp. PMI_526]
MVLLTTSLFFFVYAITISHALPTPYYARTLEARRPTVGETLTMSKTKNTVATGDFSPTEGDVTFTVGDRIAAGSAGIVFKVECGANAACEALGPVVLKFYTDLDQVADEQKHLAKINELKAVSTGTGDKLSLMQGFEGTNFSKTKAYLKLTEEVTDKSQLDLKEIQTLVSHATDLAAKNALQYLELHNIIHDDINDANVLFTETDEGIITRAQLIDWDKAHIPTPAEEAGAQKAVTAKTAAAFQRFFDTPEFEKGQANAPKKPVKRPAPRPAAPGSAKPAVLGSAKPATAAAVPGSAKPVAPAAAPGSAKPATAAAAPGSAKPAAAAAAVLPATAPGPAAQAVSAPPPSSKARPAVPAVAPANRRP